MQKQLHTALARGETESTESLRTQLEATGGLQKYQEASIQGQSSERGGDTSKVLMEWLNNGTLSQDMRRSLPEHAKLRMLEVGALKVDNACSRSGLFNMTRIDLHSQHPDIQTQDFIEMLIPSQKKIEVDGFDVVSLSLVVNYVGDAVGRGEMLKRVGTFLRSNKLVNEKGEIGSSVLPALFLVLPAPCVTNSRYLNEDRLEEILTSLGYVKVKRKLSKKLIYYLWRYEGRCGGREQHMVFKKQEIRPGATRNNFTIILQ